MKVVAGFALVAVSWCWAGSVRADDVALAMGSDDGAAFERGDRDVRDVHPSPSPLWLALQLVPSVDVGVGDRAAVGVRWQVTPLSLSWAINRRLSPWRVLVVEPMVRHGGSVELFVSPGLWFGDQVSGLLRLGARAYVGLVEHGEQLSASAGLAYQRLGEENTAWLEVGLYTLYGVLGLQVAVAVPDARWPFVVSLQIQYF